MPQVSDDVIFIALILGMAIFILIVLLAGVALLHYYETRRNDKFTLSSLLSPIADSFPKPRPKENPELNPPDATVATTIPEAAPEIELKSVTVAKVERSPNGLQTLNWWVCFIIAACVAFLAHYRLQQILLPVFSIPSYFYWSANILAIISPACIAVAWLRLTGVGWRQALLLFLCVPVGVFVIWFMSNAIPSMIGN